MTQTLIPEGSESKNEAHAFLLFCQLIHRKHPHKVTSVNQGKSISAIRMGVLGTWATHSCSLLVTSAPAWAWSQTCHFTHMVDCWWVCMNHDGHLWYTCYPIIRRSISSMPGVLSQRMYYTCRTLMNCAVILRACLEFHKTPFPTSQTSESGFMVWSKCQITYAMI